MAERPWLYGRPVHNHGVGEGLGLACDETIAADGYPIGSCLRTEPVPALPVSKEADRA